MKLLKWVVLGACLPVVVGCGALKWGDDGVSDYTRSVALPPLQPVEGLTTPGSHDDTFEVPGEGGLKLNPDIKVQTPKLPAGSKLRIEKQGKLYWLASDHKPSVLWSHLKNFWRVNDYSLANIDQRNGLLTTHWAASRLSNLQGVEHEYRLRIIPYRQGSRIYVTVRSRRSVDGVVDGMSSSTKLELSMLVKLQTYLRGV